MGLSLANCQQSMHWNVGLPCHYVCVALVTKSGRIWPGSALASAVIGRLVDNFKQFPKFEVCCFNMLCLTICLTFFQINKPWSIDCSASPSDHLSRNPENELLAYYLVFIQLLESSGYGLFGARALQNPYFFTMPQNLKTLWSKHRHRRNVTSHHSFSLLWQF